jgi:hypothetical protein
MLMDTNIDAQVASIESNLEQVIALMASVTEDVAKKQAFVAAAQQAVLALKS